MFDNNKAFYLADDEIIPIFIQGKINFLIGIFG